MNKHNAHARFSLSVKLLRDAPDSPSAQEFAAAEREAHPDWQEADREGFLSRVEVRAGGDEPSPIPSRQLLAWSPSDALHRVRSELADLRQRGEGYSLLGAVQQAAQSDPTWATDFIRLTLYGDATARQIAETTLFGLRDADVPEELKLTILSHLARGDWDSELNSTVGSVVEHWARKLGKSTDTKLLDAIDSVADLVFERSSQSETALHDRGWTERAINHAAGHAAQIWWHVANARDWVDAQFVLTIDDKEKARWSRVLADETASGAYARVILGMASDRFSGGDYPWAAANVFPMFDPRTKPERASQLWDGRLMQSRWAWSTIEGLRPTLVPMFKQSATLLPARSQQLGDFVALLVAGREHSGITLGVLQTFVQYASNDARRAFADSLPAHLGRLTAEMRTRLWRELLAPYWADRRTNMPIELAPDELREMVSWVRALPEVSDEVVAALRASPRLRLEHADTVIWQWKDDPAWVTAHPNAAVEVIAFLSERDSINSWMADTAIDLLDSAFKAGAAKGVVLEVAERLVSVSPARAAAFLSGRRT